jgi:hypothetical protein
MGQITTKKAAKLLSKHDPGTFLIRFGSLWENVVITYNSHKGDPDGPLRHVALSKEVFDETF